MYGLCYMLFLVFLLLFLGPGKSFIQISNKFSHSLKHLICYIRYIATVDGLVHKRHLIAISEGTTVEGVLCVPDVVELLPRQPEMQRTRIRIVVIYLF